MDEPATVAWLTASTEAPRIRQGLGDGRRVRLGERARRLRQVGVDMVQGQGRACECHRLIQRIAGASTRYRNPIHMFQVTLGGLGDKTAGPGDLVVPEGAELRLAPRRCSPRRGQAVGIALSASWVALNQNAGGYFFLPSLGMLR